MGYGAMRPKEQRGRPRLLSLVEVEGAGDAQLWSNRGVEPASGCESGYQNMSMQDIGYKSNRSKTQVRQILLVSGSHMQDR